MRFKTTIWNEHTNKLLRQLVSEGWSDDQIAHRIGTELGVHVSRHAIIGKRHREGIECNGPQRDRAHNGGRPRSKTIVRRKSPSPSARGENGAMAKRLAYVDVPRPVAFVGATRTFSLESAGLACRRVSLLDNTGCCWPLDDDTYCGNDVVKGSYCGPHNHLSRR